MIRNVVHSNSLFLLMILLPLISAIQTNLDVVHEKSFNKIIQQKWGKQVLSLVQREISNYDDSNNIIHKMIEQLEASKQEKDQQLKEQNILIERANSNFDYYTKVIQQRKTDQEESVNQLQYKLYQTLHPNRQYLQQQIERLKSNLNQYEDKVFTLKKMQKESIDQYQTEISSIHNNFSNILDIFSLIDDIQNENEPNTMGYQQKKNEISKKIEEMSKSTFSNSLVFLKSELSILSNQNFQDKKTINQVRSDLHSLIDEIFSKRDQLGETHSSSQTKIKEDINFFTQKMNEASHYLKEQTIYLNSLETQIFLLEDQLQKDKQKIEKINNQVMIKRAESQVLIAKSQIKIQEIEKEKDEMKELESQFQNKQFTTFLVEKMQNRNFKMLEQNSW